MDKLNRVYSLKVEVDDGVNTSPLRKEFLANKTIEITLPYTLEFQVTRRSLSSAQRASFRIYNLGEKIRGAIQKDKFQPEQLRAIQFRAGYDSASGRSVPILFNGTVSTAYSYREGDTWYTEIEAYDGGFQAVNGTRVSLSLAAGVSAAQTIEQLASLLPYQSASAIVGDFPVTNKRTEVLFGNAWELILLKSRGRATIDNGQVKALNYNEVILGDLFTVSSDSGLLGSPRRSETAIEFEMIFEPRFTLEQAIQLQSFADPKLNRLWKVIGFEHQGTISPAVAGEARTQVSLWFTKEILEIVKGVPVQ